MQNKFFPEINYRFGFGCMRLKMDGDNVDIPETCKMVDYFLENGFNYFDTAHGYISGKSETALRECLVDRYPRDRFILTDKLSDGYFKKESDIRPFFESQLQILGVDYLDFYLMHAQNRINFIKYKKCKAYETAFKLKEEGKIRHVGISFHDRSNVLDKILTEYPQIEVVQIQFNYSDYNDKLIESRKCYEVCVKHGKPCIIMEPVKGGHLAKLPDSASKCFDDIGRTCSDAGYALRFCEGFDNVAMVISGMGSMEMMTDNISVMKDFKPLDEKELKAIENVLAIIKNKNLINCTGCRYCVDGCPQKISIPDLFSDYNSFKVFGNADSKISYAAHTENKGKPADCIKCGACEKICPQKIEIRKQLVKVSKAFEK